MTKQAVAPDPVTEEPLQALNQLFEARELTNCLMDVAEERLDYEDFKMLRYCCERLLDSLAGEVKAKLPERASVLNLDNRVSRDFFTEATAALFEAMPLKPSN